MGSSTLSPEHDAAAGDLRKLGPLQLVRANPGSLCLALIIAGYLAAATAMICWSGIWALTDAATWFDPIFFQYNLVLLLLAVLLVPAVTLMYVTRMKGEKERRLRRELPDRIWNAHEAEILQRIAGHFQWGNYFGSVALVMVMITLGAAILLLSKPIFDAPGPGAGGHRMGIYYGSGANFLLLGPLITSSPGTPVFIRRVAISLTGFQFGFLGGFVYFVGHVVRSYFTLDLTPHTYVESAARMAVASLFALTISFAIPLDLPCKGAGDAGLCVYDALPLVAFFLGYFPNRALLFIEKTAASWIGYRIESYASTPLSELHGMSLAHEVILNREGFDNAENLSHADSIDLAIRTGLGYRQLDHWVGQSWLRAHLGTDYEQFTRSTGITMREELEAVMARYLDESRLDVPTDAIVERVRGSDSPSIAKLHAVYRLALVHERHRTSGR